MGEMEIVNAVEFGNPKEVLDHMSIASNVTVIKTGEDELQIEIHRRRGISFSLYEG